MFRRFVLASLVLFFVPTPGIAGAKPTPAVEILAMPDALRTDFRKRVLEVRRPEDRRLERLVDYLFSPEGLGIEYQADATYTVAEAYRTRRANCLTFTLLTLALAREAGLVAYGQEVEKTLTWRRVDRTIYRTSHVNAGLRVNGERMAVDVAWNEVISADSPRRIGDDRLFAHFYNNRAIELMVNGDMDGAIAHARASVVQSADFATAWSNLGVLALRSGDATAARAHYERAVAIDPQHPGALSNLVMQARRDGDARLADALLARLSRVQSRDPLHQFLLAMDAERSHDFRSAAAHYRRAIRLHRDEHSFHFGLARVLFELGEFGPAARALARAESLSAGPLAERYHAKLDALRAMQGAPGTRATACPGSRSCDSVAPRSL